MRETFELSDADVAGRIGELSVPRRGVTVETPALLPVVNPNIDTIEPSRLADEFGAEILITNAYIIHGSEEFRERALEVGLHEMLGFDGAIMTDSGSFQLAEYGEIDVTTEEILEFQHAIGSDVGTPVDVPTPPDADRETAERDLETTEDRLEVAESVDVGEMLVTAPVQGAIFPDLRERAGRTAAATDLDVFPVGGVVPLLNDYRFAEVVDVVAAAKRGLEADCPVHLFGAGHPMMFALAAALGCDLFDSAAYALYARDDRYLTVRGTEHLADLDYLPCSCPVCAAHDPDELREFGEDRRHGLLAEHNLHVSFAEIRRIKQAIRAGDLLELVETRARAHPAMLDGYRALADHADWLEASDPVSKGTFRYLSTESADRPEVLRHHDRLDRLTVPDRVVLTEDTDADLSARTGPDPGADTGDGIAGDTDEVWRVIPPFGPVAPALSSTYPLTAEVPDRRDPAANEAAARGIAALVAANPDTDVLLAHDGWGEGALAALPDGVERIDLAARGTPASTPGDGREGGDRR